MSTRLQSFIKTLPDQLKRLTGATIALSDIIVWQGTVTAGANIGKVAAVLDLDSSTWADNNRRVILLAEPGVVGGDAYRTQSHRAGQFIDGSSSFKVYFETPEDYTGTQHKFQRVLQHVLLGQNGAPYELFYCANDTEPVLQGVNGGVADASFTSAGLYAPYGGVSYVGGI
jgi:hypothetical protein